VLGNGSAFGDEVPPRPGSACVVSRGVAAVPVLGEADAQAPAPISSRQRKARIERKFLQRMTTGRNKLASLPVECGELGDVIGANTIGADFPERPPPLRISSPGDHSGADLVCARDEVFVDERNLLPEILGAGGFERRDRIDVPAYLENAGANGGEDAFDIVNDAVVEGMHGAIRRRLAYRAHHKRLDARPFDLDVDVRAIADGAQYVFQRGNLDVLIEPKSGELDEAHVGDATKGVVGRVDEGIVVNDHLSVRGGVHVQLDRIGAELDRPHESGDRILRERLVGAAMGDLLRRLSLPGRAQLFPRMVALDTMSAKL
jgi:hypothetical protein